MRFNINNYVRVRLTDRGRSIHREWYEKISKQYPPDCLSYRPPTEDEEGWSRWQLWDLMNIFGPSCMNGCIIPFETEIDIVEDQS